jgi:long-chain acyl-CoA synthetase
MGVAVPFETIPEMFRNLTQKYATASRPVLMVKSEGSYRGITYAELARDVELFACGLASLGIRRGDRISIISENRPEWVISDQAIVGLGAIDVPIYPTNTAKQIAYILNDARVRFVVISNQFQLNKVLKILEEVKSLEKIILMADRGTITNGKTMGLAEVMSLGAEYNKTHPGFFTEESAKVKPEDLLTLIYTSGTTGNPKGVMLSHRNLVSNIHSATQVLRITEGDRFLSFLPLSHSFERMAGYYTALACGTTIAYAESVETVRDNMLEVQPTVIGTVPRLFERIHARILKQVDAGPPAKRKLFFWSLGIGRQYALAVRRHQVSPALRLKHLVADRLVLSKVRARTGGKIRFFVSGGAALAREFGEFFEAMGLRIIEGYGLTETSPVISVNLFDKYKFGSVGKPIPGVEVKIDVDGEILTRGPHIMKGYWNDPKGTGEVIDRDGWLHTGDVGLMDSEGFLYITDRKKHLFVSSGGKNIAPQPIENLFMSSRYVEQFVLIGDRRMFLTALIVPDFDALKEYADARNLPYASQSDLTRLKEINELIEKDIASIQKDLASYERVRKFTLLDRPFTIENGEITPSLKVRRKVVEERYADLIESMYRGIN